MLNREKKIKTIQKLSKFILILTLAISFMVAYSWTPASADVSATTRYVSAQGSDSGSCNDSSSPCRSIQYAVNKSSSGDTILVAGGTYTYNSSADTCSFLPSGGRSVVCIVDKTLTILGGYSTSNWSTPDIGSNTTVIDGSNTYRGVFLLGYNSKSTSLDMEGLTIQNSKATGPNTPGDPSGIGGGMSVAGAYVTLRDMNFSNNSVYGLDSSSGAGGAGSGGGLNINWSQPGTSSLLERVTFDGNQSFGGTGPSRGGIAFGALFVNGSVTIKDSTFTNNYAQAGSTTGSGSSDGLHADALGGAIGGGGGTWDLENITATGNRVEGGNASTYPGGGFGGAIHVENATYLTLRNSTFTDNTAQGGDAADGGFGAGGGVLVNNTSTTIEQVRIIHNSAIGGNTTGSGNTGAGGGGGLYLWHTDTNTNPTASVTNSIIADNYAAQGSSGNPRPGGGGGGIQVQGLHADINYTTIADNRLGPTLVSGQALLVLAAPGVASASANVNNSIIANHTEGKSDACAVLVQSGNTVTFNNGLFADNIKNTNSDGSPMPVGTINGLDTMMKADSVGFVSPGSPDWNYHITGNSPAINNGTDGDVKVDIDDDARPVGSHSDLGADEFTSPVFALSPDTIYRLADNDGLMVPVNIQIPTDPAATWTASTSADWLHFENANSRQATGVSGDTLLIHFDARGLPLGTYQTNIEITGQGVTPATLQVTFNKVDKIYEAFLPLARR